ncbi:hypothetical protein LEP1GSC133_3003 [Leptospira borgpetersenii serovar Pomona str. 200901868]|uniref:Uncharacterized protein n=1 Tax=Leptospira borgpetersenii serovar Pomona str. 200901868 TaxID=1192866 RepID=M6WAY1_LEPBO|nr:hypothetical protein LEP1GSC133_3003 [Leptospira borgpetersenii serovar Pomona str. 200901868]
MFEIRKYTYKCVLNPVASANRSETLSFPSDPSGAITLPTNTGSEDKSVGITTNPL